MSSARLSPALTKLLPPLVRILLRNGMAARTFHELVKSTYVAVARDEFGIDGRKATISRIAILTGLTRKEVQSLIHTPLERRNRYADEYNRAARVMTGWLRDLFGMRGTNLSCREPWTTDCKLAPLVH